MRIIIIAVIAVLSTVMISVGQRRGAPAPAVPAYPPARGIPENDTATKRLDAVQNYLRSALVALEKTSASRFAGYVEKSTADTRQALADTAAGLDYLRSHPEADPWSSWTQFDSMNGREPDPLPPTPRSVGTVYGRGGASEIVPGPGIDPNAVAALNALHAGWDAFRTGPGVKPYQVGDIGGYRNRIRDDISSAVSHLIAGFDLASASATVAPNGERIVNGSFESPVAPANGPNANTNLMVRTSEGSEPAGLGWRVHSGSPFAVAGPIIVHQGYTNAAQAVSFTASAYDGSQWLDFTGGGSGSTSGASISQIIATTPGEQYALTFAVANSPFPAARGGPHSFSATVTIKDSNNRDLISPGTISHNSSTPSDYRWERVGPIVFKAEGTSTIIEFKADYIANGLDGLFLDGISIKPSPR